MSCKKIGPEFVLQLQRKTAREKPPARVKWCTTCPGSLHQGHFSHVLRAVVTCSSLYWCATGKTTHSCLVPFQYYFPKPKQRLCSPFLLTFCYRNKKLNVWSPGSKADFIHRDTCTVGLDCIPAQHPPWHTKAHSNAKTSHSCLKKAIWLFSQQQLSLAVTAGGCSQGGAAKHRDTLVDEAAQQRRQRSDGLLLRKIFLMNITKTALMPIQIVLHAWISRKRLKNQRAQLT